MFRVPTFLKLIAVIVVATVLGAGSAWWAILGAMDASGIKNGPWFTSSAIGATTSDPYTRAQVALTGLLALNKSEAVYYTATQDSAGDPLRGACTYEVTGRNLAARWWSLTAYGSDHYLISNEAERYSYNVASLGLRFAPIAKWRITVSSEEQSTNWLPVKQDDFFSLTLRLYNPSAQIIDNLASVGLPEIKRASCRTGEEGAS